MRSRFFRAAALVAAVSAFAACSSEDPLFHGPATGGGGGSAGEGGSGGSLWTGDMDAGTDSTSSGATIDPDAACAATSVQASITPVNVLILFDRSGSMTFKSKWDQALSALGTFFQAPSTAGLRVALRFFPDDACTSDTCDPNPCSQPLVELGPLTAAAAPEDAQEGKLVSAVAGKTASPGEAGNGGTPLLAALQGAEIWGKAQHAAHPNEKTLVLLVTDGEPNGCGGKDYAGLNAVAASARDSGVLTYVVGLSGFFEVQMNDLAAAGGTGQAFFIGKSDVGMELVGALQTIQSGQVSCDIAVPEGGEKPVDPTLVNVLYTPGGGAETLIGQVNDAASCGPQGGWYYDDPAAPKTITLCPSTCGTVQADLQARLDVLLGCATQPVP